MNIDFERKRLFSGFDGNFCKIDPKFAKNGDTEIILYSMLYIGDAESYDVFFDSYASISRDGGKSFSEPKALISLDRERDGLREHFAPIDIHYHKKSRRWLVILNRVYYKDERSPCHKNGVAVGSPAYTFLNPETLEWDREIKDIDLPFAYISAHPHGQIKEGLDGGISFTFYSATEECNRPSAILAEFDFDGESLVYKQASEPLLRDGYVRGFCEPSAIEHNGKIYMTIRTDEIGLYSESRDGVHFSEPQAWCWEDGTPIGNKNTMQRFLKVGGELYLVYTRRDRLNEHVFRNRAPLYMTRIDTEKMRLIKGEEIILVPELGARLGNFGVYNISENEARVIVAEWMQLKGCERYGSDNSVWLVRVKTK